MKRILMIGIAIAVVSLTGAAIVSGQTAPNRPQGVSAKLWIPIEGQHGVVAGYHYRTGIWTRGHLSSLTQAGCDVAAQTGRGRLLGIFCSVQSLSLQCPNTALPV